MLHINANGNMCACIFMALCDTKESQLPSGVGLPLIKYKEICTSALNTQYRYSVTVKPSESQNLHSNLTLQIH